jgi:Skp family chaperone for outer membrane proteins
MLALTLILPASPATAQTTAPKVAIANPTRIFNDVQETKDLQAKFKTDQDALAVQKKERELKLQDLKQLRDNLKPDSQQWSEKNQELLRQAVEYEVWMRMTTSELERQQKLQMKAIFDKIMDATAQVATAKGIDLVIAEFAPELPENLNDIQANQLREVLVRRNVLFNAATADISADVIAAMDARYRSGK